MKLFHSPQHHPAVHTFQTVTRGKKKALFLEVQKKPEAGNFWTRTRETLQWPCKVTRGVGRAGEG